MPDTALRHFTDNGFSQLLFLTCPRYHVNSGYGLQRQDCQPSPPQRCLQCCPGPALLGPCLVAQTCPQRGAVGGTWHPPPAAGCPLGPQGRSQVFLAGAWERACDSSADRGDLTPLSFHRKLERFYIKLWNAPPGQGLAENPETPPQVKRLRGQRLALTRQKGVQASEGGPQPVGWGLGRPAFAPAAMSRSFIQVCAENAGVPPSQREDVPAVALLGWGRGRGVASGPPSLVPPCALLK